MLSQDDQAWLDVAIQAWDTTSRAITRIARPKSFNAIIFDESCAFQSATALIGGEKRWNGKAHVGKVGLPDGSEVPVQVVSFAAESNHQPFFIMAAPSIWRSAEVDAGILGLHALMTAVLLHEATHVAQLPTYGQAMTRLTEKYAFPDDFNDDSIQQRFEADAQFSRSVERETELLFAAAAARDDAAARSLAAEARAMIAARRSRWFRDADAPLAEAEDIWLTFEGSGQWAAFRWLSSAEGGQLTPEKAMDAFGKRGKWWTQKQGLALFLALERIDGDAWKPIVFGNGELTALQLLDAALAR